VRDVFAETETERAESPMTRGGDVIVQRNSYRSPQTEGDGRLAGKMERTIGDVELELDWLME